MKPASGTSAAYFRGAPRAARRRRAQRETRPVAEDRAHEGGAPGNAAARVEGPAAWREACNCGGVDGYSRRFSLLGRGQKQKRQPLSSGAGVLRQGEATGVMGLAAPTLDPVRRRFSPASRIFCRSRLSFASTVRVERAKIARLVRRECRPYPRPGMIPSCSSREVPSRRLFRPCSRPVAAFLDLSACRASYFASL